MGSRLFARSSMWLDNSEGARVYKAQLATDAQRYRWFADSPLEEAGFEPSVPRDATWVSRGAHLSSVILGHMGEGLPFRRSADQDDVSTPSQPKPRSAGASRRSIG